MHVHNGPASAFSTDTNLKMSNLAASNQNGTNQQNGEFLVPDAQTHLDATRGLVNAQGVPIQTDASG